MESSSFTKRPRPFSDNGGGTINGNGRNNFTSGVEATRPISIWTALCNQVHLQNINIVDAAMWTVVPMQSDFLTISNLNITGSSLTDTRGCPISGCYTNGVTYPLKNILFDNVNSSFAGGFNLIPPNPPEYAGQYPENTMWTNLPAYGYYLRHATNVTFTNCFTSAASADARPWLATNDVASLKIIGPTLNILPGGGRLVLQWNNGFTLQTATNVGGNYADVTGATSFYTNQFTNTLQRFFRLRQ